MMKQIIFTIFFVALLSVFPVSAQSQSSTQYACIQSDSTSFPVRIKDNSEKKLNVKKTRAKAKKRLKALKGRIRPLKKKIKRLVKKKNQTVSILNSIAKFELKLAAQEAKLTLLKNLLTLLKQCRNGQSSDLFPHIIETAKFEVLGGGSLVVQSDLVVRSEETVSIRGTLMAAPGSGASIVLFSRSGDIEVSGVISGADAGAGALTLRSRFSRVLSGPEVKGVVTLQSVFGGSGSDGGSLVLLAPQGAIRIADGASLHIGNGGNGADMLLQSVESLATGQVIQLENSGGNSGALALNALEIQGLDVEQISEDGQQVWVLKSSKGVTGGRGGEPGKLSFAETPQALTARAVRERVKGRNRLATSKRTLRVGSRFAVEVIGADGGIGFFSPGNGQSLEVTGGDGVAPGEGGYSVVVTGGNGGKCRLLSKVADLYLPAVTFPTIVEVCKGGKGGDATARGGDGAKGSETDPLRRTGGRGGFAEAHAGISGFGFLIWDAPCANATAQGGRGGDGSGDCPQLTVSVGGTGGSGGDARAEVLHNCDDDFPGNATATGGSSGNGGAGSFQGGRPGPIPGTAESLFAAAPHAIVSLTDGLPGQVGTKGCPVGCAAKRVGSYFDPLTFASPGADGRGGCGLKPNLKLLSNSFGFMYFDAFGLGVAGVYRDVKFSRDDSLPEPERSYVNRTERVQLGACNTPVSPLPSADSLSRCTCHIRCEQRDGVPVDGIVVACRCRTDMIFGSGGNCSCTQIFFKE